ncbi:MAG TPA: hypothetical protein PLJ85_05520 [Candidatus Cloacimonas sp.]|nr:hypothetical protein [Candidatus Cloacimonas sp.]
MGCRTPIRQMPSGILFSKDYDIIGKSEFANPKSIFVRSFNTNTIIAIVP